MASIDDFQVAYARRQKTRLTAATANKDTVFTALHAANIARINVAFDGEGDSGQIEHITVWAGNAECPIPDTSVRLLRADWDHDVPSESNQSLRDAIETMCYDFLEHEQGGWENDGGAYGEFQFDVAARTIELEFNSRYSDVHTSTHSF